VRSLVQGVVHAVALTRDPEERFVRKLSNIVWAVLISPELRADPICESSLVNNEPLELSVALLVEEPLVEELPVEFSKLVSES
jgi:uncharacterized membrane protein YdfJ with MMPL/SSD domain